MKDHSTLTCQALNNKLFDACLQGNLVLVKYLLTGPDLKEHANIHTNNDAPLRVACMANHLEIVKYLLTDPQLHEHANLHVEDDEILGMACCKANMDIIRYVLTSPELKTHANIHARNDAALRNACDAGHLEVVRYLLTSSELNEHANLHGYAQEYEPLCLAFENSHMNVVSYLLYDLRMEVSPAIYDKLEEPQNKSALMNEVAKRDLFFRINQTIPENKECAALGGFQAKPKI